MIKQAEKMLKSTILPYWENLIDTDQGGFCGFVNFDQTPEWQADKGVILHSRILWFFSTAATCLKDPSLLQYADHAYRFLTQHCFDKSNGGLYWMVDCKGRPLDTMKHTYNQAFGVYALSAYYEASGNRQALEQAIALFELIEQKTAESIGYGEAYSADWRLIDNDMLSGNGILAQKTMNTLLHLLEAYTELYRISRLPAVYDRLSYLVELFRTKVHNPSLKRLEVFFDKDLNSLIDLQSYGHDIEAAWLLDRACEVGELKPMADITTPLVDAVVERAMQPRGCFINECHNGHNDPNRIWWVQAEAAVSLYNKYQQTKEDRYLTAAQQVMDYIDQYFVDKRDGGEWFWDLDEQEKPTTRKPITEPWKCPYHNGRMCLEMIRRNAQ